VSNLRVFGCTAYAHVPDALRQKPDQKAVKMRFVGYSLTGLHRKDTGYMMRIDKESSFAEI
jgi:hypothetical protein